MNQPTQLTTNIRIKYLAIGILLYTVFFFVKKSYLTKGKQTTSTETQEVT